MPKEPETQNSQDLRELAKGVAALPADQRALLELELRNRNARAAGIREPATPKLSYLGKLQSGLGPKSVFCFLFSGGFQMEFSSFASLARLIGRDYSFYTVIARGTDGVSEPHQSVEEMAAAYISEIRSVQPHGPYLLLGECLSAPVAYETARQLRSVGEPIGLLALLGARGRPPWFYQYLGRRLGARVRYHITRWSESPAPTNAAQPRSRHLQRAHKAYGLAVRRYQFRPYDGKVTVLANEKWCEADPTLGWVAPGGLEVYRIPGNHQTYLSDHGDIVAETLRKCLEESAAAQNP